MKRRLLIAFPVLIVLFFAYREGKGKVVDWYSDHYIPRTTTDPATVLPDHVCLTWNGDPRTSVAVQWRMAPTVAEGFLEYRKAGSEEAPAQITAEQMDIEDRLVKNDPMNRRFSAVLTGLEPGTVYAYRVGGSMEGSWSEWAEFTTAPAEPVPFSFVYMGDVQKGFDYWGKLMDRAYEQYPGAAFYVIAGDLVNNGDYRDQWDAFFNAAEGVFDRRPIVPVIGNHDYDKKDAPRKYLDLFTLPQNGPEGLAPEHAYAFNYGNALFVALDSNFSHEEQTPWLEAQLRNSQAKWKIVVYHHPAYSSAEHRVNDEVVGLWTPLFDKYDVDLALQGHDHAYLRTFPMEGGQRTEAAGQGTRYVVAVAGNKYYEQVPHDYAEVAFADVSTYQVVEIGTNPDRLTYRAYDLDGQVRDEFVIEK